MTTEQDKRLEYMADELESLKAEVTEMKAMLKDVYTLLAGNPIDKDSSGLIKDFKQINKEVYALKYELKRYKSYFYALITLVGLGVLKFITDVLEKK
jgi:hypothetical protein